MDVFVTGASGWIGFATVQELIAAGHRVTGLARSDASAERLRGVGVEVLPGDLDDLDSIRRGSEQAEAVIHLANKHDWSNPANSNRAERAAVDTIGQALLGSDRPFLFASGVAFKPGQLVTEEDESPAKGPDSPRGGAEALAMDYAEQGVHSVSLRFAPTVHGPRDHGFIALITAAARQTGVSAYVGDGANALVRRPSTRCRRARHARPRVRAGRFCGARGRRGGRTDQGHRGGDRWQPRPARAVGRAGQGG